MNYGNEYIRVLDVTDASVKYYNTVSTVIVMPRCDVEVKEYTSYNYELCNNKYKLKCIEKHNLIQQYLSNFYTRAIVFTGLEPFDNTPYDIDADTIRYPMETYKPLETDIYDTCNLNIKYASSYTDMIDLITILRRDYKCTDDIVIYTNYSVEELLDVTSTHGSILPIIKIANEYDGDIIIKYTKRECDECNLSYWYFNDLLGVYVHMNQYVIKYSQNKTKVCSYGINEKEINAKLLSRIFIKIMNKPENIAMISNILKKDYIDLIKYEDFINSDEEPMRIKNDNNEICNTKKIISNDIESYQLKNQESEIETELDFEVIKINDYTLSIPYIIYRKNDGDLIYGRKSFKALDLIDILGYSSYESYTQKRINEDFYAVLLIIDDEHPYSTLLWPMALINNSYENLNINDSYKDLNTKDRIIFNLMGNSLTSEKITIIGNEIFKKYSESNKLRPISISKAIIDVKLELSKSTAVLFNNLTEIVIQLL